MNDHNAELHPTSETRPAPERTSPDLRRLEVTANRFGPRIEEGIQLARDSRSEISVETARCIGHVLGRAYGRDSHLADFGRTGEGTSLDLRDEYLGLYNDADVHPAIKEWINWLGTYLVDREGRTNTRWFMNEYASPQLERILVETEIQFEGQPFYVHLPASLDSDAINALAEDLADLSIPEDDALQAFLSLPDVDASAPMLMEAFHENYVGEYSFAEDAGRELAELDGLEEAIDEAVQGRSLPDGSVTIDYGLIEEHVREAYDLVQWKGRVYVFNK
ncbi:hypothetical protein [uncultured Microbacterium sp.]|uniref:hypothetical protein n=1 Tax=uncultured Microbacterium sp. TaxID=191216 RepID=UPI00261267F1|nr:hypothetical protein [uncultured Microbacterium sp.]